jgi:linoleoyl-CoA desaturase
MHQLTKLKFKPEPQNGYFFTLKHRVDRLMSADNYTKNHQLYTSAVVIFLFLGFVLSYLSIAWCTSIGFMFLCYGLLGVFSALIFLNITHDAAHNCLFKNRKLNNLCIYFLDLTGANSFIWKIRHINLHHPYPNVPNFDADIKQSNFVRLN